MHKIGFIGLVAVCLPFGLLSQKRVAEPAFAAQLPQAAPVQHTYRELSLAAIANPGAALVGILQDSLSELRQTNSVLQLKYTNASQLTQHYRFQQVYLGIAVYEGVVQANLTHEGKLLNLLTHLKVFSPVALPVLAVDMESVRQRLLASFTRVTEAEPVWLVANGNIKLCFRFVVQTRESYGKAYEVVHDAEADQELKRNDLAMYHSGKRSAHDKQMATILPAEVCTTGRGYVYLPDPLTTAQVPYACPYCDNANADNSQLNAQRQQVLLKDIAYTDADARFRLRGPYIRVEDVEAPNTAIATTANGDFFFTRSQSGFDDCMTYYHADSMQRYVRALGFTNLSQAQPLTMDSQGDLADNSYFLPSTPPFIALGVGGVNDAQDADVIVHEYGHFLSWMASNSNSGFERRGLDEGIGDYIAASYSKVISSYGSGRVFSWDGNNEFWPGRPANTTITYPAAQGQAGSNFYLLGSVWCSALMEAWDIVGKTETDRAQFQELYFNAANMTLRDAALQFMKADSLLHGTTYRAVFARSFCRRGMLPGNRCAEGDTTFYLDASGRLVDLPFGVFAYPNPSAGQQVTLNLGLKKLTDQADVALVNAAGQVVMATSLPAGSHTLRVSDYSAGLYYLWVTNRQTGQRLRYTLFVTH